MEHKELPPDWDAIGRYLAGESEPDEAAVVRAWLESNPGDRALVSRLADADLDSAAADVDVEAALRRVHARMGDDARRPALTVEHGGAARNASDNASRRRRMIALTTIAAAAVAFAAIALRNSASRGTGRVLAYTTGVGRRDSVRLADGSRVILGPSSRLVVPAAYGKKTREVQLDGDAYFDVRHDASTPFAVRTARALIEDIGTTFTIESDPKATTSVAVLTGSVRLRGDSSAAADGVVLAAGDRGSIDSAGRATVERSVVRDDDASWTSGTLHFREAPLARVAAELQRWYGVTLQVPDSALLARHVTATIGGEPIDQVLNILGLSLGVRIERHGDTAIVSNRGTTGAR